MASIINSDNGVASGSMGLKQSADTSGNLVLQSNGNTVISIDTSLNANLAGTMSAVGNVTGGNILTAGLISSTGNVTGGNILTAGLMSGTGNITGGNVLTGGLISSTGNIISSANIVTSLLNSTSTLDIRTGGTTAMTVDASQRLVTPSQTMFLGYAGVNSVTSGTIPYGGSSLSVNIGSAFNASTYTFTAPIAGKYLFTWQFFSPPNSAATVDFQVNGASVSRHGPESATLTNYCGWSAACIRSLSANDTVRVQYVGGTIHTNPSLSYFSGYLLG